MKTSIKTKTNVFIIIIMGLVCGILTYWFQDYNESKVWGISIWLILALSAFLASSILSFILKSQNKNILLFLSLGILLAVVSRIIYDTSIDKSSHNLAPLEIIFVLAVAVPSILLAIGLSSIVKKIKGA